MKLGWKTKYDPNKICSEIANAQQPEADGVSFQMTAGYQDNKSLLNCAIQFPEKLPDPLKEQLTSSGLVAAAAARALTPDAVLKHVAIAYHKWKTQPESTYKLLTRLSARSWVATSSVKLNGVRVTLSRKQPSNLRQDKIGFHWPTGFRNIQVPPDYLWLHLSVRGVDSHHAGQKAFDILELLLGSWNLAINSRTLSSQSYPTPKPVNHLQTGPVYTLHQRIAGQEMREVAFWYRPDFVEPIAAFDFDKDSEPLEKQKEFVSLKIRRHFYKGDVADAIRRYNSSLDYHDANVAFTKLWGVVEFLTDSIGQRYDILIRRTSFLYENYEHHRQVLDSLRDRRNEAVHHGTNVTEDQYTIYLLKRYAEQLIYFHLLNYYRFRSLKDAAAFLDLSPNKAELRERIQLLKNALKFRK
jgi:hypothetical protein